MYNGKENNPELGLNWLSFGFREYDPAIGRFPSVDPIADQFAHVSGFNYAENDPVQYNDLWGLQKGKDDNNFIHADDRPKTYESGYEIWLSEATSLNPNLEISLTLNERLHRAGKMLENALPSAKVVKAGKAGTAVDDAAHVGDDAIGSIDDFAKTGEDVIDDLITISPNEVVPGEGVSASTVADLVAKMKTKGFDKSKPIEGVELYGKKYLLDGHHRVAAAKEAGVDVTYRALDVKEAIAKYKFRDVQEIIWRAIEFNNRGKN